MRRCGLLCVGIALVVVAFTPAFGAAYPQRHITIVVPFAAGSGPDALVRTLASGIAKEAGVSVIVDNKPGANSILAAQSVAKSAPDGYTVLITGNVVFTGNPHVLRKLNYDPVGDFTPVNTIAKGPMFVYVNREKVPARGVLEFIDLVRKNPGKFTFAYTSITSRLPMEVLKGSAGLDILGIPYRAGYAAIPDLLSGRVDILVSDFSAMQHVRAGKLGVLGVTDGARSPLAPEVPTFEEAGIRGMGFSFWLGAYLPAGAQPDVVRRLNELLETASNSREVKEAHANVGTIPMFLPLGRLAAFQAEESARWGQAIREAGIKPE